MSEMPRIEVRRDGAHFFLCTPERAAALRPAWFDRKYWMSRGDAAVHSATGRGEVLIAREGDEDWVIRHYRRGGLLAPLLQDRYLWSGLSGTRAWREFVVLQQLSAWGLPVPAPVGAHVHRRGVVYRADLITMLVPDTQTLSSLLNSESVADEVWARIGQVIRQLHARGVHHVDLNAHNILVDQHRNVTLIDFDNARLRPPGPWVQRSLARLQRSLRKVALETGCHYDARGWELIVAAYGSG